MQTLNSKSAKLRSADPNNPNDTALFVVQVVVVLQPNQEAFGFPFPDLDQTQIMSCSVNKSGLVFKVLTSTSPENWPVQIFHWLPDNIDCTIHGPASFIGHWENKVGVGQYLLHLPNENPLAIECLRKIKNAKG